MRSHWIKKILIFHSIFGSFVELQNTFVDITRIRTRAHTLTPYVLRWTLEYEWSQIPEGTLKNSPTLSSSYWELWCSMSIVFILYEVYYYIGFCVGRKTRRPRLPIPNFVHQQMILSVFSFLFSVTQNLSIIFTKSPSFSLTARSFDSYHSFYYAIIFNDGMIVMFGNTTNNSLSWSKYFIWLSLTLDGKSATEFQIIILFVPVDNNDFI